MKEDFLYHKIEQRKGENSFRKLVVSTGKVDFCSNDYLGIATGELLYYNNPQYNNITGHSPAPAHGSKGSRLLAGNYALIELLEERIAAFHQSPAALIFNSGYDANLGLLSSVPQKNDTILYDALSHASIRDGIRLSFARAFSFRHNDPEDLEKKLQQATGNIFIVTESVFSMDGDVAPLQAMVALCKQYNAYLIVDEAHAIGVIGNNGEGLVQQLQLQNDCFARVHTFGKACGVHGAAITGSSLLRDYLINFARSFIYTTALPEIAIDAILRSYLLFPTLQKERAHLQELIQLFRKTDMRYQKLPSHTAIQGIIVPENDIVKKCAQRLQDKGFDVRPILSPTVPAGEERLRIVLHAFNTVEEVSRLIALLQ